MQTESIAVIIPAYNAAASIAEAIDSVLAQTVTVSEIIVIDDGSSDKTSEIVASYTSPVRLIMQVNKGPSQARNHGALQSDATYFAFLDADDSWQPPKLARQLRLLQQRPEAVLCYTGLLEIYSDGRRIAKPGVDPTIVKKTLRICNPGISPSCVMVRGSAFRNLGGFDLARKGCEDWDLWLRLQRIGSFCAVKESLTNYRMSTTGLSSNADLMYSDFERLLDGILLEDLHGIEKRLWKRRIQSYQCYKAALTARGSGEFAKELRYMLLSLRIWPSPFWQPLRFKASAFTLVQFMFRHFLRRETKSMPIP